MRNLIVLMDTKDGVGVEALVALDQIGIQIFEQDLEIMPFFFGLWDCNRAPSAYNKVNTFLLRWGVDVNKPLVTGFFYKDEEGLRRCFRFRYEGLEEFCYHCGIMGHITTRCIDQDTIVETEKFAEPGRSYGPHLRVAPKTSLMSATSSSKQPLARLNRRWNSSVKIPKRKFEEGGSSCAWIPKRVTQDADLGNISNQANRIEASIPSEQIPEACEGLETAVVTKATHLNPLSNADYSELQIQKQVGPTNYVDQAHALDFIPVPQSNRRWKQMARSRINDPTPVLGLEDLEANTDIRPDLRISTQVEAGGSPCVGDSDDFIPSNEKAVVASPKPREGQ
ncbi:hypothetical protein Tsubulata_036634 [Turnera subulata]|uniref:CCHC-type domain-containing protein n=1 Tax=Turnera subulata TaxID=218843 RepID=A0A9Q0G8H8_9ROSI|nr:hypothetical protein Tsubulata_036634 [Turnera subulata]